jgi:DNA-binding CsgD family transcriptional regulator
MELLSDAAGDLYARLVKADGAALGSGSDQVMPSDPALQELCEIGLVWQSPDQRALPVAPDLALGKLLLRRQREMVVRHRGLLDDYERLARLAGGSNDSSPVGSTHLEVVLTAARVNAIQQDLQAGVLWDYRALEIPRRLPLTAPHPNGARRRLLCTIDLMTRCGQLVESHDECRTIDAAPIRMLVADGVGLVILTTTGAEAGALVRAPALVQALAHYFDLLWERAMPVSGPVPAGDRDDALPRSDRVIVGMLMAGLTDAAIARNLGVSPRSVRRHVAALEERAGVTTRFALGAAAVRLGWVPA